MSKKNFLNFLIIFFLGGISVLYAATQPKFSIIPTTSTNVLIPRDNFQVVQYRVTNNTKITRTLTMKPIPGITQNTIGPGFCGNPFTLAHGESCLLTLPIIASQLQTHRISGGPVICKTQSDSDNSPNPFLCSQPAKADILRVLLIDFITVEPQSLFFQVNSTGTVTVTNQAQSILGVRNIGASIPPGSNIFVAQNNCPPTLAPGASCTIDFSSNSPEGPTTVAISGDNSNTVNVEITVFGALDPVITLTSPPQSQRVVDVNGDQLELIITNHPDSSGSVENVVVDNSNCPLMAANNNDCFDPVPPGESCSLLLSSGTPYAPCDITISATGASNEINTQIAFRDFGGLIFESDGIATGKVVREDQFTSQWSMAGLQAVDSQSSSDGEANTESLATQSLCAQSPTACAATLCRNNFGPDWYLPAYEELGDVFSSLCSNGTCNFGNFSGLYWSSTYLPDFNAFLVSAPENTLGNANQTTVLNVRCTRNFP